MSDFVPIKELDAIPENKINYLVKRTAEELQKAYNQIIVGRLEKAERYSQGISPYKTEIKPSHAALNDLALVIARNEIDGEPCDRCEKPWIKINVKSDFFIGFYHTPTCHCHPVCPVCSMRYYEDSMNGMFKENNYICESCGHKMLDSFNNNKIIQWGVRYRNDNINYINKKRQTYLYRRYGKKLIDKMIEDSGKKIIQWKMINGMSVDPCIPGMEVEIG